MAEEKPEKPRPDVGQDFKEIQEDLRDRPRVVGT